MKRLISVTALAEKRKRRDSDRSDSENGSVVEIKQEGLVTGADSGAETGREQTNVAKTEEAQQVNSDDVVEAKVAVKKMKW